MTELRPMQERLAIINDFMVQSVKLTEVQWAYLAISEGFVRKQKYEQMEEIVRSAIKENIAALSSAILDLSDSPGEIVLITHPDNEGKAPLRGVGYDTDDQGYSAMVAFGAQRTIWPFRSATQVSLHCISQTNDEK